MSKPDANAQIECTVLELLQETLADSVSEDIPRLQSLRISLRVRSILLYGKNICWKNLFIRLLKLSSVSSGRLEKLSCN